MMSMTEGDYAEYIAMRVRLPRQTVSIAKYLGRGHTYQSISLRISILVLLRQDPL
jgi:hypothetical protein